MNWIKCKKDNVDHLYCVDNKREDWRVLVALKDYTPTEAESDKEDTPDSECLCYTIKGFPSDWDIKQTLLKAQTEYDHSDEVNCFYVNGQKAWMDKATRVGLVNSMNALESVGGTNYTLWLNNQPITAPVDYIKLLLAAVEVYAMQCYGVTERHYAEINAISSKEECYTYDITAGYPDKLNFSTEASE